jgi:hypothetical protein
MKKRSPLYNIHIKTLKNWQIFVVYLIFPVVNFDSFWLFPKGCYFCCIFSDLLLKALAAYDIRINRWI